MWTDFGPDPATSGDCFDDISLSPVSMAGAIECGVNSIDTHGLRSIQSFDSAREQTVRFLIAPKTYRSY